MLLDGADVPSMVLGASIYSGSDKSSIYAPIARAVRKHGAGLHLKTAGTTWLAEVQGLAESGGRRAHASVGDLHPGI